MRTDVPSVSIEAPHKTGPNPVKDRYRMSAAVCVQRAELFCSRESHCREEAADRLQPLGVASGARFATRNWLLKYTSFTSMNLCVHNDRDTDRAPLLARSQLGLDCDPDAGVRLFVDKHNFSILKSFPGARIKLTARIEIRDGRQLDKHHNRVKISDEKFVKEKSAVFVAVDRSRSEEPAAGRGRSLFNEEYGCIGDAELSQRRDMTATAEDCIAASAPEMGGREEQTDRFGACSI
ncbi:hypothetical protein EVAR_37582_1 [Eumeta japonica]|uniref:Uncharacterized protein n=1 Tax=Eumeta variegata TaxID=151549 RepID=A0A4C1VNB9_EUMVA|nr:hypothetical protein EVAR_37582_1 [Eumeta japonica]